MPISKAVEAHVRAIEARKRADDARDKVIRRSLLQIAETWDRIAANEEWAFRQGERMERYVGCYEMAAIPAAGRDRSQRTGS
jgi:hypothetical protein